MKKLFLSLAVVMSVSMFSCNGAAGNGNDSDSVALDSAVVEEEVVEVVDSAAADTAVVAEVAVETPAE